MPGLCRLCYFVRCGAVTLPYHARLPLALPMLTQQCLAPPMPNVAWRCFTRALPRLTMPLLSIADRRLCHALLFRAYAVQYLTLPRPCNSLHLLACAQWRCDLPLRRHAVPSLCHALPCGGLPVLRNAYPSLCKALLFFAYAQHHHSLPMPSITIHCLSYALP